MRMPFINAGWALSFPKPVQALTTSTGCASMHQIDLKSAGGSASALVMEYDLSSGSLAATANSDSSAPDLFDFATLCPGASKAQKFVTEPESGETVRGPAPDGVLLLGGLSLLTCMKGPAL